eukprot:TRINITY_DN78264_c0_g1_i1.p1 TRINITY_DN78264_c0_g1~~TRINITY_DN78264_c0_g1_i1.p1  ORF type:complete len:1201 (+),score=167.47 TRINITY_DN78264_c0_g1_i1:297-3899(+)
MSSTSLVSAKTRTELQDSISDLKQFEKVLSDCFTDGSRAAAETASIFLCKQATSLTTAQHVSAALMTIPSAVSVPNASPLAYACAFLAASFDHESCAAPLKAFSFTKTEVKMAALEAITHIMLDKLSSEEQDLSSLLKRLGSVLLESTGDLSEMDLYSVIKGVTELAEFVGEESEDELLSFALNLCNGRSPYLRLDGFLPLSHRFQGLYAAEIVGTATDVASMSRILSRCLICSIENGNTTAVEVLWNSHPEWVADAFHVFGFDLPLFVLSVMMGQYAWRGKLRACSNVMEIVLQLVNQITPASRVTTLVALYISSLCQAIGSIGMSAGAEELAANAAAVIRLLRSLSSDESSLRGEFFESTEIAVNEAAERQWPAATLILGVIRKILTIWKSPKALENWIKGEFEVLLKKHTGLFDSEESGTGLVSSLAQASTLPDESQGIGDDVHYTDLPAFSIMGTFFVLMRHENSRVRFRCLQLLRRVRKDSLFVFYFPSIMMLLQEEKNGLIVAGYLREIMTAPGLMSRAETCNVAFSTLVRLSRSHINSEIYGVVLVAFAWASEYAPSIGVRLLIRELERIKSSFDLTRAQIRTAAAAAIHKLAEVRPARCTDLIPFISLCITPESMEVAPRATSLCFDIMYLMAKEEVLDPTKAVKVILKSFPGAEVVDSESRRSYLRLLSVAAGGEANKKRRKMMQSATDILRKCITNLSPIESKNFSENSRSVSWVDVQQAALSLSEFTVDEILRSAFADEEPLINLEEEKKRLDRIEEHSAQFVRRALITSDRARLKYNEASVALEKLIKKIVSHEWQIRKKSSFDPERIGKLRATSEALRRARKAQGLIEEETVTRVDQARSTYMRATASFPVGVIRSVFQLCVAERENTEDNQNNVYRPNGIAMRVVADTNILSPALPWVSMVEETISTPSNDSFVRASCLRILRKIQDNSFEVKEKQSKWFGEQCPLLTDGSFTSIEEARQLFLGLAEMFPNEQRKLFMENGKRVNDDLIEEITRSCVHISEEKPGLQIAVEGLLKTICSRNRLFEGQARDEIERVLVEAGLKRCKPSAAMHMIINADSDNLAVIRIACLYGNYQTISFAVQQLLSQSGPIADKDLNEAVGRAIRRLPFSQRRDILLTMFGDVGNCPGVMQKEMTKMAMEISAHALMVGALAPGGKALLFASLCSSSRDEQRIIQRFLNYISSTTVE